MLAFMLIAIAGTLFTPSELRGATFPGTAAQLKTATTTTVGPSAQRITIFGLKSDCKARVVTTNYAAVWLSFGEPTTNGNLSSSTLSNAAGHYQAASTTVAYDSGLFGCGVMTGYAVASTSITASEF